ncbi:MAG TPA: hypothetical protein VHM90_07800, partial [Phycisphaerae bacterium]|nr:hypothetical protein [Phycisphaerae bacterium]
MEPRVLMTTVYGGETFVYTDALGNTVTATLNGNVVAELVGAQQYGGGTVQRVTTGGYLVFGDIAGRFTAGPRSGLVIGNGSLPVTLGTQSSATTQIPGLNYTSNQIHLQALASNAAGNTYGFNAFDTDATGTVVKTTSTPNQTIWTFQVVGLSNTSGASTVLVTIPSNNTNPALTPVIPLDAENARIPATAYNPVDGKIYFEVDYSVKPQQQGGGGGGAAPTIYTNEIWSFDPQTLALTDIGAINAFPGDGGAPELDIRGMTFVSNASAPGTATLFVAEQPNATADPADNLRARLAVYAVDTAGTFTPGTALRTINVNEGFGSGRAQLNNIVGLATLPGTANDGTGNGFIYAMISNGAASHVVQIDLTLDSAGSANSMSIGDTTDLIESLNTRNPNPKDGRSPGGFTFNPTLVDPFTGQLGAWLSIDTATHTVPGPRGTARGDDLIFINHQFRVSAGDVFTVYSNIADIQSAITFQGNGLYGGNSGDLGSDNSTNNGDTNASPGATGTVYIGYRGEIPDNSTNDNFVASAPYLSGQLTGAIGIMPALITDVTDPTVSAPPTRKLFAGLMVAKSLEHPFNSTGNIVDNLLNGSGLGNFGHVTGLAVSPDGRIVVVNSSISSATSNDQLALVDPTTGFLSTVPVNVTLANSTTVHLQNVEALAYGDPDLTGTASLYAVYDLGDGNGPTLGTININTGVFTPTTALQLGAHARVSAMAFTAGGTSADPNHQAFYVIADPNSLDNNVTQSIYSASVTLGVNNAPTFNGQGDVTANGGIGLVVDFTGNGLQVASALFDTNGRLLVDDRRTGRLMDVNLNTGVSGLLFATDAGTINPTVTGVALDPNTLTYIVVDNLTGFVGYNSTANLATSAIMMKLNGFNSTAAATNLGRFLVDGTMTGKVTVPGSMELFYTGYNLVGDAAAGGTWRVAPSFGDHTGVDRATKENYFHNNFYIGGDIRYIYSLTHMGTNGVLPSATSDRPGQLTGLEITAAGKVGVVYAKGSFAGVVHAGNQAFAPGLVDSTPLVFGALTDAYSYTLRGSADATLGLMDLTTGKAGQAGSVFSNNVQSIDNFTASFTTTATPSLTGFDGGFAFVLQNQGLPVLGASGSGLGYRGILHSAALGFAYDPVTDGITMQLLGNGATISAATPLVGFAGGNTLTVQMSYSDTTLTVAISDTAGDNFTKSYSVNLASLIGSHAAYVGFTGSSGTLGSMTEVQAFVYNGQTPGTTALPQRDIQHYRVDADYTFAAGYLTSQGNNAPFGNTSFQTAQFLGALRSNVAGQPETIHLAGVLEGAGTSNANPINQGADYYAFSLLAGQTVDVSVVPRTELNDLFATATATNVHFAVFDPDGNIVATDYNWLNSTETNNRTIRFTADRPGAYRVAIANNTGFTNSGSPGNINFDLTIKGVGTAVGNLGIGAVTAGGQVVLTGSKWVTSSTNNSGSTVINPSIWADTGDVGAVIAGANGNGTSLAQSLISTHFSTGLGSLTISGGYAYTGTSSQDIFVPNGNLRMLGGGQIGALHPTTPPSIDDSPDIFVGGNVGLIQTPAGSPMTFFVFSKPAGGNIQVVDAGGVLHSTVRTDKAIGVVRAGSVDGTTMLHVDADRSGADGTIDLIDDAGSWSGAPIVSGPGGNVRFMRVGGTLFQDPVFDTTATPSANGGIVYDPGPVSFTDDSGASITLTPSSTQAANGTNGNVTTLGQLTVRSYGVRGAGGVIIVDVTSTTGLTVDVEPGASGRSIGDIGTINVQGAGVAVSVVNGAPALNGTTGTMNDVILKSNGGAPVSALDIRGTTIDHITNTTAGDILNVNVTNVGIIDSKGSIGTTSNSSGSTGAALIGLTTFGGGAFPFDNSQYAGVAVTNAVSIQADKAIGNIRATGVVGTITANLHPSHIDGEFHGIKGLIVISGSAAATSSGSATTTNVSVWRVNIGEGIGYQGSSTTNPDTGIFANGKIMVVAGNNADIRGSIVSTDSIGTVTLTDGSIINSQIAVFSAWTMIEAAFNGNGITLPARSTNIDRPVYVLDSISIAGKGGILASAIWGSSINDITVGSSGFGILDTDIQGVDIGTINSITAGGWGLINSVVNDARVNKINATG